MSPSSAAAAANAAGDDAADPKEEGILVAIRMRPLNSRESQNCRVWKVLQNRHSVTLTTNEGKPLPERVVNRNFFTFDKTFGEESTTRQVYNDTSRGIVKSAMKGLNGTIFAYGQTSSGKTFTMQGSSSPRNIQENGGIVQMAAIDIFNHIDVELERVFLIRVSFMEIYNEEVRDLLVSGDSKLTIREDKQGGVFVNSSETIVTSMESLLSVLYGGEKNKSVAATRMNERSSRSHTIFRITVESRPKQPKKNGDNHDEDEDEGCGVVRLSTLNLVDLAGSESVRHTGATGDRQKEGGKINQSLLTLSRVIESLGKNATHVNFRDSKLTRILQPSLSGNARMVVIACATPSELYMEETRSTLQFASRAKLVKTRAQVNEVMDDRSLIKKLQRELKEARRGGPGKEAELRVAKAEKRSSALESELEKERSEAASRQVELESRLGDTTKAHSQLLEEVSELRNGKAAAEKRARTLEGILETEKDAASNEITCLCAAKVELEQRVISLERNLETEKSIVQELQLQLEAAENIVVDEMIKSSSVQFNVSDAASEKEGRGAARTLQAEYESMINWKNRLRGDIPELEASVLQSEAALLESERDELKRMIESMMRKTSACSTKVDKLPSKVEGLGSSRGIAEERMRELTEEVAKATSDKKKIEAYTKITLTKFQEKYLVALQDCKAKLEEKNDKIGALVMRSENDQKAQKREEKLLSSAVFELGMGIMANRLVTDSPNRLYDQLSSQREEAAANQAKLHDQLKAAKNSIAQLTDQVVSLQGSNDVSKKNALETEAALEKAKSVIAALKEEAKSTTELHAAKAEAEERASALEKKLEKERSEADARQAGLESRLEDATYANVQMANHVARLILGTAAVRTSD